MSLNCVEINKILEEQDVVNSFIQNIHQPDYSSLILELFKPGNPQKLYFSLESSKVRFHKLTTKLPRNVTLPRFTELLRSRIKGGRVTSFEQCGLERILKMEIKRAGEILFLWFRMWSGGGNIFLTDPDNLIIDAFYRRPKKNEIHGKILDVESVLQNSNTDVESYGIRDYNSSDFNSFIEKEYFSAASEKKREVLENRARTLLEQKLSKLTSNKRNLLRRQKKYSKDNRYKEYADIIMANLHAMEKGEKWLTADDFYNEGTVRIQLEAKKSPKENAELYYQKHKKAESGRAQVRDQLDEIERRISLLDQKRKNISSIDFDALNELAGELKPVQNKNGDDKHQVPGVEFFSRGFRLLAGRNARENDILLRKWVRGNDYWVHTRDYPGGYVFIKYKSGKTVPLDVLIDAGNLAVLYSKAKNSGKADCYYTQAKYLRRPKEGKKGLVLPTQEKNLYIELDQHRLKKLFNEV